MYNTWKPTIIGRASLYNKPTERTDGKIYVFLPGCYEWDKVRLFWDHEDHYQMAETPNDLKLRRDSQGLIFEATPSLDPLFLRLIPEIFRGRLGASIGFWPEGPYDKKKGIQYIEKCSVFDVSLTFSPAAATKGKIKTQLNNIDLARLSIDEKSLILNYLIGECKHGTFAI